MTEKTLTTENIKPALDALRGELAPWPVVAKKQDRLNTAQLNAANSGITSSLVAQIIANTAAIRALESAITGTGLRALVVASLPAVGTTGILYIVPVTTYDPDTDADVVNYSNEYIWIPVEAGQASEGHYEQVGQTGIVINNGQLTITVNGVSVGTFTANQSGDTTAAITVPTNADYVDLTTDQTVAGDKTWTGEQSFTLPIVGSITGTASKAIADEDGTGIKTGYVNVAGNQTVTGQKTWSGENTYTNSVLTLKQTGLETGVIPASNQTRRYRFTDKNNTDLGWVQHRVNTSGESYIELYAVNKFDNSQLSPQGAAVASSFAIGLKGDGTRFANIMSNLYPASTNTYALGSSSYQWSSVYAQSYYYNGTQWGLDQANVWSAGNSFQTYIGLNGDRNAFIAPMWVGAASGIAFLSMDATKQFVFGQRTTDANNRYVYDATKGFLIIRVGEAGGDTTVSVIPFGTDTKLGDSTNKWKTLNGINPGALSLPNFSQEINVDTTGWVYDGTTHNSVLLNGANPSVNGWLWVRISNSVAGDFMYLRYGGGASSPTVLEGDTGVSLICLFAPIIAGQLTTLTITKAPAYVKFYPCLGNV